MTDLQCGVGRDPIEGRATRLLNIVLSRGVKLGRFELSVIGWLLFERRRRSKNETKKKAVRDRSWARKKDDFKVEHLGMLLAEQEGVCASRTGNERISDGGSKKANNREPCE